MIDKAIEYLRVNFLNIKEKGFFHLFSASIFVKVFAFGSQFFVAWWLTVEEIGSIKVIQSYFSLFTVIVLFGFNSSILKLCSENRPEGQILSLYNAGKKYVKYSFLIFLPIIALLLVSGILSIDSRTSFYLSIALIGLYPAVINECDTIYLQARKLIKLMSFRLITVKAFSLISIIILTFFFGFNGYITAYALSFYFAFLLFRFIIRKIHTGIIPVGVDSSFKLHWEYSKFAVLSLVVGQIGSHADVFLMSLLVEDTKMIGFYSFALLLILVPTIFSSVIQSIVVPYISNASSNIENVKRIYKKYQKIIVISTVSITAFSITLMPFLVDLFFSGKYNNSIEFFNILIIAWFFNSISQLKGLILWGVGYINYNSYNMIIVTALKFIIGFILLQKFELIGLAYSIMAVNFIGIFTVHFFFQKGLNNMTFKLNDLNK